VTAKDPPLDDFVSHAALGIQFEDEEARRRAEEVSVWDSVTRAARLARKKPGYRFVAALEIPTEIDLRRGKHGHWAIPRYVDAAEIKGWVAEVVEVVFVWKNDEH
jgi:hypothetical protein